MNAVLTVEVQGRPVGELVAEGGEFVFTYRPEAHAFVSLTMPVRAKGYVFPRVHPLFEMHLPEGYLLAVLKKQFAKLTRTDDFGLLSLLAPYVRGRVQYSTTETVSSTTPLVGLDELLATNADLFDDLVERFALRSALSGVQPKVLAPIKDKATLQLADYIVKAWGPDYPELALNEFYCMEVVRLAGIPVPEYHLSSDEKRFVMRRFDLPNTGPSAGKQPLGFEDIGVLQGKTRDDKYTGSVEQLIKTIKSFANPKHKTSSLHQVFKMTVLNQHLQNGDAHLKNFGMVYEDASQVRLAPAYDVVSTTAYIKRDVAALTLMGSKKWWSKPHLLRFGQASCDLTLKQAEALYDQCLHALEQVNNTITQRLKHEQEPDKVHVLQHLAQRTQV